MNKNIVLIGLRGSGKSTIGKLLAKKIDYKFIDLDKKIEQEESLRIKDIVEKNGWEYFRKIESKLAQKIANENNAVIALGGGTILNPKNKIALKKTGLIIYLHEKPEICAQRIANDKNRPPLTNENSLEEEMKKLYKERHEIYKKSADLIIQERVNPKQDNETILKQLNILGEA